MLFDVVFYNYLHNSTLYITLIMSQKPDHIKLKRMGGMQGWQREEPS